MGAAKYKPSYLLGKNCSSQGLHIAFPVNKLCISIHCRKRVFGYDVHSSLKELRRTAAVNRLKPEVSRIIPGNWGKAESGWLARPLIKADRKVRWRRQNSLVPLTRSRVSVTRKRNLAARNDEKPFRAGSSSSGRFRAWVNRSYPEGKRLLLCISTDG
jgi:hypothetical protein